MRNNWAQVEVAMAAGLTVGVNSLGNFCATIDESLHNDFPQPKANLIHSK